jgi:acetyl esterase/lipase
MSSRPVAPPPSGRARRRRPRLPVALAVGVLAALSPSGHVPAASVEDGPAAVLGSGRPGRGVAAGPGIPFATGAEIAAPAPEPLPDPGVAPGACHVVTYTPATATEAHDGQLCRPADPRRGIAVIIIHGGSGVTGRWTDVRPWADVYRDAGYVTLTIGYHLFVPGGAERPVFPRPEEDVKAAVQFLRGTAGALGARPDRIVVQGHSAGARLGAVAYTTPDDPWFAGPALRPRISTEVNAFIGFYHPYDGTMQYDDQYYGGAQRTAVPAVRERRDKGNSLARAADARGPALFVNGGLDWVLITEQQNTFAAALRARGQVARTLVVPGGRHGFDDGGPDLSRLGRQAATETLRFLDDVFPEPGDQVGAAGTTPP